MAGRQRFLGLVLTAAVFLLAQAGSARDLALAGVAGESLDVHAVMAQRLGLMRDVAAFKWLNHLPIEDPARERVVLQAAVREGLRHGIRPESSRRFFRVQMEAAKDIQRYWFRRWQDGEPPRDAPDLQGVTRPRLLELGRRILEGLAEAAPLHDADAFRRALTVEGLEEARVAELLEAVRSIRRYPHRLARILDTGVLRVGTTGDYAPFSFSQDGETYTGVDIDLARDLATGLGVELVLVATSWPTLMQDLAEGRFDIAMSGVSRTPERARRGYFSRPYHVGGKMPIARCEDARRFGSLAAIDQPGVRVIVNPGGTNERFVDTRLSQAEKVLHRDNRTIFSALAAGAADVMITDAIEVTLQARKYPELCGTMETTLNRQEKAYLMPKDEALNRFVDEWLGQRLGDGTVSAVIGKYLAAF